MPSQCQQYKTLSDSNRRYTHEEKHDFYCDYTRNYNTSQPKSPDWDYSGWYRVVGGAGNQISEHSFKGLNRVGYCGTVAGGWMTGGHPTTPGQTVTREINFRFFKNNHDVQVTNCCIQPQRLLTVVSGIALNNLYY